LHPRIQPSGLLFRFVKVLPTPLVGNLLRARLFSPVGCLPLATCLGLHLSKDLLLQPMLLLACFSSALPIPGDLPPQR
jgi:hypothetical protein